MCIMYLMSRSYNIKKLIKKIPVTQFQISIKKYSKMHKLTPTEYKMFYLLIMGKERFFISEAMGIKRTNYAAYYKRLRNKLGYKNVYEITREFYRFYRFHTEIRIFKLMRKLESFENNKGGSTCY